MTYDSAIETTYKDMFRDVRDGLAALDGWSIKSDALDGSDYFVMSTPVSDRDVLIGADANPDGTVYHVSVNHGADWDSSNNEFAGQQYRSVGFDLTDDSQEIYASDEVVYWFQRRNTGFVLAAKSERGWMDGFGFAGYEQIDHFWDGMTIASDDRPQPAGVAGSQGTRAAANNWYRGWGRSPYGWGGDRETRSGVGKLCRGRHLEDENEDLYAYSPVIWRINFPTNDAGYSPALGKTEPLWVYESSGMATSHRDSVETADGTETFEILKQQGLSVAIRAD